MAVEEVGVRLVAEDGARFEKATRDARKALLEFVMATQDGSRDIEQSSDRSGKAVVAFVEESGRAYGRLDAFAEIAIGALRRVGEIAVNAMLEAGRATAQFMQDSVSAAGNFESTLNRFSAVTGDSLTSAGMDVQDFSDLFLQMGADTQYSAQQAGEAAVNLAKGGIAPAEIAAGGLAATLALAAAGELDLAASAEILAKQLGVWADKGVTAIQITDLLAQAANASTVDVDELANGLANVQGRAAGMGVEYDELVQTMALISPAFESASTAGTSLNNFFARLIPNTEKAEDAMKDLGLATSDGMSLFFDSEGAFIGMEAAIGLLSSSVAGLSEEERAAAFNIIFGNDAMGSAIALSEANASGYNEMGANMLAAGDAASQAAARNQGYNFALEEMGGSLETLQIVIGTELLPVLTDLIQNHITPGINSFLEFSKAVFESEDPIGTLIKKIDELLPGFSQFITDTQNAATNTMEFFKQAKEVAGDALEWIKLKIDEFAPSTESMQSSLLVLEAVFTSVWEVIKGVFEETKQDLTSGYANIGNLTEDFAMIWENLKPVILGVLQILGAAILAFIGVVVGFVSGFANALDPLIGTFDAISVAISVILDGIYNFYGGWMNLIKGITTLNLKQIKDGFFQIWQGIFEIVLGLVGGIVSLIIGMGATVLSFIAGFVEGIVGFFKNLYEALVGSSIIVDLVNDILGWFNNLFEDGKQIFFDLVENIKGAFSIDWYAIGKSVIDGIVSGITNSVANLTSAVQNAASSAYNAAKDYLLADSPSKLFMEIGEWTMEGFAIGIDDTATLPTIAMDDALMSMMSGPVSQLASAPVTNNTYNTTNVYEGAQYGLNVRTQESAGTVGNTIRALQSISRVQKG